ncbi:ladinin-1 [Triplophysa rosa]|uniref:Lad1 protein n=1 Tax=Triplophysa rosa TaxID=992332 RepID=A0A9W7TC76_TRIRA|nr:ladinin-1 [Triplophysa rosa]KAI7794622.1 Lad1 protein [Triplophysa rosa]
MSISRKNWSALSTLTRQWTVEDEEEVEREKRRKERGSSTTVDPDESPDKEAEPHTSSVSGSADVGESGENSGGGLDQLQMDFVEMLRVRDERRRVRLVETLRKNKEGEGGTMEDSLDGETHVELTGEKRDEGHREKVQRCVEALMSPEPSVNPEKNEKSENASNQNSTSVTPTKSSRKFVSSLSISFDKSPSSPPATSRGVSPLSPKSPPSQHPEGSPYSPFSPTHSDTLSPTLNGNTEGQENGTPSNFEPATKPAFTRQSSRTISFRMMRKKEEDSMPLQRSASVRIATKTFESNKSPDQEDEQKSPFQRNSRQRISSRSIQEKMERLAQASQKWEMAKSPTLLKTGCLADEVSRKRELFEKEEEKSHIFSTQFQDFRNFSSGISGRINQWVQNKTFTLSHSPSDLRHVNISSKKSLFEKGAEQEHK